MSRESTAKEQTPAMNETRKPSNLFAKLACIALLAASVAFNPQLGTGADAPAQPLLPHLDAQGKPEKPGDPLYTKARNRMAVGWWGEYNSPQVNIDGSIRVWIKEGDLTIGFSIFNATAPNSVRCCLEENYLPHVITEFERDGCAVQIRHFVDKLTIDGKDFAALYSRVAVRNNSDKPVTLDPGAHRLFRPLRQDSNTVPPGATHYHDYILCVDRLLMPGADYGVKMENAHDWPADDRLLAVAKTWEKARADMAAFWKGKLDRLIKITKFPNTDARHVFNKLRVGYITNAIIMDQTSDDERSWYFGCQWKTGQEKYNLVVNHDAMDVALNQVMMGELPVGAREQRVVLSTLNNGRFDEKGYNDAPASQSLHAAISAMLMGDAEYARNMLEAHRKLMRAGSAWRKGPFKTLDKSRTLDAIAYFACDDYALLNGLAGYHYLCEQAGNREEAEWAEKEYRSLLDALNELLRWAAKENGHEWVVLDKGNNKGIWGFPNDKPGNALLSHNGQWWGMCLVGRISMNILNQERFARSGPAQDWLEQSINHMYSDLAPDKCIGHMGHYWFQGYNVGQIAGILAVDSPQVRPDFREYPILHMLYHGTCMAPGPYVNGEGNSKAQSDGIWEGVHSSDGNPLPSTWANSVSNLTTLIALCAPTLDHKVCVGRGIPTEWLQDGMQLRVENVPIANRKRFGYEVRSFSDRVELEFLGDAPDDDVLIELPVFNHSLIKTSAGKIDDVCKSVVVPPTTKKVTIHAAIPEKQRTFPEYPLGYESLRFDNSERK